MIQNSEHKSIDEGKIVDVDPVGVQSSNIGSFVPEASYRPIPIVWFTAAYLLQVFGLIALYVIMPMKVVLLYVAATAMLSFGIGYWIFDKGMKDASKLWRGFTIAMLLLTWAYTSMIVMA